MKRSLDSLSDQKTEPKTSDNSTSTGQHMKRVKKDGNRPKHQLRRAPSHASSAQEYMKSEWTCDELDLTKAITPLMDLAEDRFKLVEELFSIFSIMELKAFTPDILKEYSVNQLKELCLQELESISTPKIKFMCGCNRAEDFIEPNVDELNIKSNENKQSLAAIPHKSDDIQLSVDDNEYSDFLGAENRALKKPIKELKDAEVQVNETFESSSDDEVGSDDNREGEGWRNIFAKTQMEILELEMRARAIRVLLKAQTDEESTKASVEENKVLEDLNDSKENKEICVNQTDNKISNESIETNYTNSENEHSINELNIDVNNEDIEEDVRQQSEEQKLNEIGINEEIENFDESSDSNDSKELNEELEREDSEVIDCELTNDRQSVVSDSDKCDANIGDNRNDTTNDSDHELDDRSEQ